MKYTKEFFKYVLVFIIIVFLGTTLLTLVASIPRKYVEKNLKQAAEYFNENNTEIRMLEGVDKTYAYIHTYGEEMLFNIIYCLDTDTPLKSVMEAKYYERFENEGSNIKYIKLVENDLEPNAQYIRYWHGSMIFIKPLLMFLTIEQINILNAVLLAGLTILFLVILFKKKYYAIAIAFIIAFILTACWYVPYTFEYVYAFYMMLITAIIAVLIESKNAQTKNKKLSMLFFVSGVLTGFFDFLSAEILAILVPLLIVLTIRIRNKTMENIKKEMFFLIKSLIIWGLGYCLIFIAKWAIASIVLQVNALDYVVDKVMIRVNGQVSNYSTAETMWLAIKNNYTTLFLVNWIKDVDLYLLTIPAIVLIVWLLILDKKDKQKMKYFFFMIIISIIPYIRYIVLANHSIRHIFMTFRCQMATIMCIILICVYGSNKEKLFSDIKKKKSS